MPKFIQLSQGKFLGEGCSRRVVELLGGTAPLVEKRATSEWAKRCNLMEQAIWEKVKGTKDEELFVPVIATAEDGSWSIMPKVQVYEYRRDMENDPWNDEEFKKKLKRLDKLGIWDIGAGNVTMDGKVLDYAGTWYGSPEDVRNNWNPEGMR
jgi:hypothetical protein